jgi:hypothetical protein
MNKNAQKRKHMETLGLLSPEQLEDCANRGMSQSSKDIKQYLWELKEVERATVRMKDIDAAIAALPMEEQLLRDGRLDNQRREFPGYNQG